MKSFVKILLFFISFSIVFSQFGKNKVQYKKIDWKFIQSTHFDIYFYKGGEALAEYTADKVEEMYKEISTHWNYKLKRRVPIMIYSSHNDFQQSLIVQSYLDEGVGGVTELFKNRIALPYEGSYAQFRHVIHHELVHAVMNDMLYDGTIQSLISNRVQQVPLWFSEGLAEWESVGWNTKMDMTIRDAVLNNSMPPIYQLNYYLAYQGGASLFKYISSRFGREKVRELLHKVRSHMFFDKAFEAALGISPEKLNKDWHDYLRKQYWPEIIDKQETTEIADRITDHMKSRSYLNNSPALSPKGDKILYLSNKDTYMNLYIMDAFTGEDTKLLIKGNTSNNFEELHFLSPGMSWSPDGKYVAFSAKGGDQDYLYLVDVESEEVREYKFNLDGIFDAQWSPDGKRIAVIGNKNGESDIYIYNFENKQLINLTNDLFSDIEPSWSPDGEKILFASDRRGYLNDHLHNENFKIQNFKDYQYDIYEVDIESKIVRRITDTPADERSPVYSPNNELIAFVSDRNGISNIFFKNINTNEEEYPVTNLLTGAFQLQWSNDGEQLIFTSFFQGGWDIYSLKHPYQLEKVKLKPTNYILNQNIYPLVWSPPKKETKKSLKDEKNNEGYVYQNLRQYNFVDARRRISGKKSDEQKRKDVFLTEKQFKKDGLYKVRKYKTRWSLDFVSMQFAYDNILGANGYYALLFSDISGAHSISMNSNFVLSLSNTNIFVNYGYTAHRTNFYFNGYHYANRLRGIGTASYHYRNYGLGSYISYPFNKFNRLDFGFNWINFDLTNVYTAFGSKTSSFVSSLSYIKDNILWGSTGPFDGQRFSISTAYAPNIPGSNMSFITPKIDFRNYTRLGKRYSFAFRFSGAASRGLLEGKNGAQIFRLGGVNTWLFNDKYRTSNDINFNYPDASTIEKLAFTEFVTPLRGAVYNEKYGHSYALVNLELRFPFIDYLIFATPYIPLQGVRGALFLDAGTAMNDLRKFQAFEDGKTKDLVLGYGIGIQAFTPFFGLFRFDIAWRDYWNRTSKPRYYFSIGADF